MSMILPAVWSGLSLQPLLDLANLYDQRGEPKMRDRFLILAAAARQASGQTQEADRLLHRLLQGSPHHLLRSYRTFTAALDAEPVCVYLQDLWQNYPPETVTGLLAALQGRPAPTKPAPAPATPLPRPAPPPPAAKVEPPRIAPRVKPPVSSTKAPAPLPRPLPHTSWLAVLLGVLVLMTGLALAARLFLLPLLP